MKNKHAELELMAGYFKVKLQKYLTENNLTEKDLMFCVDEIIATLKCISPLALKLEQKIKEMK